MKIKETYESVVAGIKRVYGDSKTALENLSDLGIAVALAICAYYNYKSLTGNEAPFEYYSRVAATSIIVLVAAWLLWRNLKRPRV